MLYSDDISDVSLSLPVAELCCLLWARKHKKLCDDSLNCVLAFSDDGYPILEQWKGYPLRFFSCALLLSLSCSEVVGLVMGADSDSADSRCISVPVSSLTVRWQTMCAAIGREEASIAV